ncbi:hypothetical protein [Candidatus Rhodobacter oscarellae]|nr:hypothetical protein [Candidatus Rhodobacter lobularis]
MNRDRIAAAVTQIERKTGIEEHARMAEVRAMGFVPSEVGPEIPMAPARGPVRMLDMMASYPKGDDDFEMKAAGFLGRKTLQRADSFDVMAAMAARHKRASPFSPAQVAMGRFYRDLVEKHESAGVKCSSLESLSQRSAGSGSDFMDAVLRDRERIGVLRKRIGSGSAMVVRRIRPSDRESRASIMDRRLVDIVCIEDGSITDVLRAHGWVREGETAQAKHIKALQVALREALDRMMGPVRRGGASVAHFGTGCLPVF